MDRPLKVLYEDGEIIVIDKPSGLLVTPSRQTDTNTLTWMINRQVGGRLYPCHRLDRETSGGVIFARGKKNQKLVMQEFHRQAVDKTYVAFVRGRPARKKGRIEGRVQDHQARRFAKKNKKRSPRPGAGKWAVTDYRVTQAAQGFSVVEVYPKTGRTHQIRIHLSGIGHPLLGERMYAFGRDFPVKFRRVALHAKKISFRHPVTGKTICVESPLPKDMKTFLEKVGAKK